MKNIIQNNMETKGKKKYCSPEISVIKIDNDISLVMMSSGPQEDPTESIQPEYFSIDPFKLQNL